MASENVVFEEYFPPCKRCGHEGLDHDEEFGECSDPDCECRGYEPSEALAD